MKKIFLALLTLTSFVFAGCSSAKVDFSAYSKAALICVRGNSTLPWYVPKSAMDSDEKKKANTGDGLLTRALHAATNNTDPEFNTGFERLDYAEDAFRQIVCQNTHIEVLEKSEVVTSKKYKILGEGLFKSLNSSICATDYKNLSEIGRADAEYLLKDVGADCGVILSFQFNKKIKTGNKKYGEFVPYGELLVTVVNSKGKEILHKKYSADGAKSIKVQGKGYDKEELVALYPELIDTLINLFVIDSLV